MSIEIRKANPSLIGERCLKDFKRDQVTTHVLYQIDNELKEKEVYFEEVWDHQKKSDVCQYLKQVNGSVYFVFDDEKIIGFGNIDYTIFDGYMNMPFIHISSDYRNKGLGKKLFVELCKEAKKHGAKKLYISGHPAVETQTFYKKMGCVLAQKVNKELLAIEPLDIQLEKSLDEF